MRKNIEKKSVGVGNNSADLFIGIAEEEAVIMRENIEKKNQSVLEITADFFHRRSGRGGCEKEKEY